MSHSLSLPAARLLEGIVTSTNDDGTTNISPMGPLVDKSFERLLLRPFQSSTTYANLKRTGVGVLHVTDDVELLARAAVGTLDPPPPMIPLAAIDGQILADACRWYAFRVDAIDDTRERTEIVASVVDRGSLREFFGFNRAKHAVIEAAIVATRLEFLPVNDVHDEFARLAVIVKKTAGQQERQAFAFLQRYIEDQLRDSAVGVVGR